MRKTPISSDKRVQAFAEAAKRYCSLIESRSRLKKREFVLRCAEALPEIYLRAVSLLGVRPSIRWGLNKWPKWQVQQWKKLDRSLGRKLGCDNCYRAVFNAYQAEEATIHSLSEDLADIYLHTKRGLRVFGKGDEAVDRELVWNWAFSFHSHWGHDCVSALRPLQDLVERYCDI